MYNKEKRMIHIVTVYDSLNYGSYYQAQALKDFLSKFDKTDFLDIHHQNLKKDNTREILRSIKHLKFARAKAVNDKYRIFKKKHKSLELTDIASAKAEDYYVFGSDEIWNLDREKMKKSREFFGVNIPGNNKIAYAPSVNTTSLETFKNNPYCREALKAFKGISVRDTHSKEVIGELIGSEPVMVVDPTLLVDKSFYESQMAGLNKKEKYLMIYSYGAMFRKTGNEGLTAKIKELAKENGMKVISVGARYDFCDESIMATPEEFLWYVANADFIITDTFHGSIFSTIFEKNFVSVNIGNKKVNDLLNDYRLSDRMLEASGDFEKALKTGVDYTDCNEAKAVTKNISVSYLREMIK